MVEYPEKAVGTQQFLQKEHNCMKQKIPKVGLILCIVFTTQVCHAVKPSDNKPSDNKPSDNKPKDATPSKKEVWQDRFEAKMKKDLDFFNPERWRRK